MLDASGSSENLPRSHAPPLDFRQGFFGRLPGIAVVVEEHAVPVGEDQVSRREYG